MSHVSRRFFALALAVAGCTACAGRARDALHPTPDLPSSTSDIRGTEAAARVLPNDDQVAIFRELKIYAFGRPDGEWSRAKSGETVALVSSEFHRTHEQTLRR